MAIKGTEEFTGVKKDDKWVRILIADDHEVVRNGTRMLLEKQPGLEVCGEASNGREAVAMAEKLKPDIAILDVGMPELNGLEATRQIKRLVPETEVLIFTGYETEELVHDVFLAGARSYILKTDVGQYLLSAIKELAQHRTFFTSRISEMVFSRYLAGTTGPKHMEESTTGRLTPREREIVQLLAEGKSNKEVATTLGISVKTSETHRAAIMRKLKMESFSDLVRYAIRNNIIEP